MLARQVDYFQVTLKSVWVLPPHFLSEGSVRSPFNVARRNTFPFSCSAMTHARCQ